jgi:hypothetical protein
MSDATFNPFDLPSSFDPLGSDAPATPARRRRPAEPAAPARQGSSDNEPTKSAGVGGRLAHLIPAADQPHAASGSAAGNGATPDDGNARLKALEEKVAILTHRFDELQAAIDQKLKSHQDQLLRAVASLVARRR